MGASILMGTQYGAKDYDKASPPDKYNYAVRCCILFILSVLCILLATPILHILQVDSSIMKLTTSYMRIIFIGLVFTFLYNFFSTH